MLRKVNARLHRPAPGTAMGFTALVLALSGVAYAAIPAADGVIHACYGNSNGNLSVVHDTATCKNNETRITWNQQGPQGVPGTTGPQGPKGDPGATDAATLNALTNRVNAVETINAQQTQRLDQQNGINAQQAQRLDSLTVRVAALEARP